MPAFGPYRGWASSADRARLVFKDTSGAPVATSNASNASTGANTDVLLTGNVYKIEAPLLEPKERKFAGYTQPYSRIHYEMDFTLGAEVDIGCGTQVSTGARAVLNQRNPIRLRAAL